MVFVLTLSRVTLKLLKYVSRLDELLYIRFLSFCLPDPGWTKHENDGLNGMFNSCFSKNMTRLINLLHTVLGTINQVKITKDMAMN